MKQDNLSKIAPSAAIWLICTLALAVLGTAVVLDNTRDGPGVSGDSVYYMQGAKNMLAGQGFSRFSGGWETVPITGFPPFYSTALIIPGWINPDLTQSARILNSLLMGGIIFLASLMVYRSTQRAAVPGLLAAGLVLASERMLYWGSWVMSELLFIFLMLLAVYISLRYFTGETHSAFWQVMALGAASLIIAAAILTRYVGVSVGAALGLMVLFFGRKGWQKRLFDAVLVAVLCLGPFVLWLQRNARVAGTLVNRQFTLHVVPTDLMRALASEIISWFVPRSEAIPPAVRVALFSCLVLGVLILFVLLERRRSKTTPQIQNLADTDKSARVLTWMLATLIPLYLAVLIANSLFLDASTSLPAVGRYLLPVYIAGIVLVALILQRSAKEWSWGWLPKLAVTGYVLLLLVVSAQDAASYLRQPEGSFGYTDMRRSWVAVVDTLAELEPDRRLIANNVELVYVLADRPAYAFPIAFDHYVQQARADFEIQLDIARERLAKGAVIVYFGAPEPEAQEILDALGVKPWRELPQATFYTLDGE